MEDKTLIIILCAAMFLMLAAALYFLVFARSSDKKPADEVKESPDSVVTAKKVSMKGSRFSMEVEIPESAVEEMIEQRRREDVRQSLKYMSDLELLFEPDVPEEEKKRILSVLTLIDKINTEQSVYGEEGELSGPDAVTEEVDAETGMSIRRMLLGESGGSIVFLDPDSNEEGREVLLRVLVFMAQEYLANHLDADLLIYAEKRFHVRFDILGFDDEVRMHFSKHVDAYCKVRPFGDDSLESFENYVRDTAEGAAKKQRQEAEAAYRAAKAGEGAEGAEGADANEGGGDNEGPSDDGAGSGGRESGRADADPERDGGRPGQAGGAAPFASSPKELVDKFFDAHGGKHDLIWDRINGSTN